MVVLIQLAIVFAIHPITPLWGAPHFHNPGIGPAHVAGDLQVDAGAVSSGRDLWGEFGCGWGLFCVSSDCGLIA